MMGDYLWVRDRQKVRKTVHLRFVIFVSKTNTLEAVVTFC